MQWYTQQHGFVQYLQKCSNWLLLQVWWYINISSYRSYQTQIKLTRVPVSISLSCQPSYIAYIVHENAPVACQSIKKLIVCIQAYSKLILLLMMAVFRLFVGIFMIHDLIIVIMTTNNTSFIVPVLIKALHFYLPLLKSITNDSIYWGV